MNPHASPTTPQNPASTLAFVIACVRNIFAAIEANISPELRTAVLIGKPGIYSEGAPPRVLFVEDVGGTWGDAPAGTGGTGYVAGIAQGCTCYVWGAPNTDPFLASDAVNALVNATINALLRAARGRIAGASFIDPSPQNDVAYGAARAFRFTYSRGVPNHAAIWALPPGAIAPSPMDPARPPGSPASTVYPSADVAPQSER